MTILKTVFRCDWCLHFFRLDEGPQPGKCEQCDMDLCVRCAEALGHKTVRRADDGLPAVYECPESCIRWGSGPMACIKPYMHAGACKDHYGNTTLTFTASILGGER